MCTVRLKHLAVGDKCTAGAESPLKLDALPLTVQYNIAASWHTVVLWRVLKYYMMRLETKVLSLSAVDVEFANLDNGLTL